MRRFAVVALLLLLGVVAVDMIGDSVDGSPAGEVQKMDGPGDIPPTPHP